MRLQTYEQELREKTGRAERILRAHLPAEEGLQKRLIQAMNYSLLAGGKRLRPILMWETYRMCGGEENADAIESFMAAIEMIHTYSLVHDDLPAMDNDRYRRGKETTWYAYGEAMGILAGDSLLNYAFETATKALLRCAEKEGVSLEERAAGMERISRALSVLAGKAGLYGMIGGQAVDVEDSGGMGGLAAGSEDSDGMGGFSDGFEGSADSGDSMENEAERILFIHQHKTAALIEAAMMTGAILAGASGEQVEKIEKCAYNVGIAFQIQDDILDVTGDSRELGKPTGSDAQNQKRTYVSLKGLERAGEDVERLSREAADILDGFEREHEFLKHLILALIHRRN